MKELILFISLLIPFAGLTQSVKQNGNGEWIVQFEDGTWRYFEAGDSILLEQGQAVGLSMEQVAVREKILVYYEQTRTQLETLEGQLEDQRDLQVSVSHDLQSGQSTFSRETQKNLETQIRNIGKSIHQLEKNVGEAGKKHEEAMQLLRATPSYQAKWLESYEKKNGPLLAGKGSLQIREPQLVLDESMTINESMAEPPTQATQAKNEPGNKGSYEWLPEPTKIPDPVCSYAYDGTDPLTNQHRIDVSEEVLFEFTHEPLRSFYKDKPYLTCKGYLSTQPGYKYLTLEFIIRSERGRQSFGSLAKGTALTLRLIDGTVLYLTTNKTDNGSVDMNTRTTTYIGTYVLSKKAEKILSQSGLDLMRVVWSTGYEDYDIYNLDFFVHQFRCLNDKF